MTSNLILPVEEVKRRRHTGYPEGIDTLSAKQIPILLARIEELENALQAFARASMTNEQYPRELVEVYLRDCDMARSKLDIAYSKPASVIEDFGLPAE